MSRIRKLHNILRLKGGCSSLMYYPANGHRGKPALQCLSAAAWPLLSLTANHYATMTTERRESMSSARERFRGLLVRPTCTIAANIFDPLSARIAPPLDH